MSGAQPHPVTERLLDHIDHHWHAPLPEAWQGNVTRRLVDLVGCAHSGFNAEGNTALRQHLLGQGRLPEAVLLGSRQRAPMAVAALLNAVQARSYDHEVSELHYAQSRGRATGHLCASIDLAALAVAQGTGATGGQLLKAAAIGGDLAARLATAEGFNPDHSHDLSGTVTAFGAATAAGLLLGLERNTLRHALGLLPSLIAGSLQPLHDGALSFKLPQGWAAYHGISAAQLAHAGWTGLHEPLFSPHGYFARYTHAPSTQWLILDLGRHLHTRGLHKAYPGCFGNHAAIEAALALAAEPGCRADAIKRIEIELWPDLQYGFITAPFDQGAPAARALFNLRYATASTLQRGTVTLAHYQPDAVADPDVLALCARTELRATLPMDWGRDVASRVHVTLADNRTLTREIPQARGFPGRELSDAELDAKLRTNLRHHGTGDADADRLSHQLWQLATADPVPDCNAPATRSGRR